MFIPIEFEEFIKVTIENNKDIDEHELRKSLTEMIEKKKKGATCENCYNSIWAIGSAMVEWDGCFSCITGETDNSNDYEIAEVCFDNIESVYENLSLENKYVENITDEYCSMINNNNDNIIPF